MEVAELFNHLESNQPQIVEEIKKTFHENFNATKESWLVCGLFDYYVHTSSVRSVEILVGVREPHDKHLFDKITESLRGSTKLQALTLLGHVVRKKPTWLYKIANHQLMKELLKLLKVETDILSMMSTLLLIIVLLPMIPCLIGPFLPDIFEVFSRLAAWKFTNPTKLPEGHLLHLQVALYTLFQRLYGMYPCNFLSYLRLEYSKHENLGTFKHTIRPMLDSVKMHPLLVINTKEGETNATRWKSMEPHDVILECAKFAVDSDHRSCSTYRSRSRLDGPATFPILETLFHGQPPSLAIAGANPSPGAVDQVWSPSLHCGYTTPPPPETPTPATPIPQTPNYVVSSTLPQHEGTSPPEAAIEATPETTPIKDTRNVVSRQSAVNSNVVRALNSFGSAPKWPGITSNSSTPTQSQPSSPMKKEPPFQFPPDALSAFEQPRRDSLFQASDPRKDFFLAQKIQKVLQDRGQMSSVDSPPLSVNLRPKSSGVPPTSPLRIVGPHNPCMPNSPIPMDPTAPVPGGKVSRPTPEKNGFRFEVNHPDCSAQDERELCEINWRGEPVRPVARQCDSVLQDIVAPATQPTTLPEEDYEECQHDSGSPCTAGGLHMPNSRSMLDFARRVALQHRQRFYSQCTPQTEASYSGGSSPGDGVAFLQQVQVRRTNSCPEMKKALRKGADARGPASHEGRGFKGWKLREREEYKAKVAAAAGAFSDSTTAIALVKQTRVSVVHLPRPQMVSAGTQTVDHSAPLPFEHLFLEVLLPPTAATTQPSPAPSESPYAMLDRYIDTVAHDAKKQKTGPGAEAEAKVLREQIFLLNMQLQFERHRREVHAERNRRLLGKSRSTRAMEEHNSALREQLSLLQTDIEQLHAEEEKRRKTCKAREQQFQEDVNFWQHQCNGLQREVRDLKAGKQVLEEEFRQASQRTAVVVKECQQVEKKLLDVANEMNHALAQASAGQQLRADVERLQKELLLMGELQQRYREQAARVPCKRRADDEDVVMLRDSSRAEIAALHELVDSKTSLTEATRARISELEAVVTRRDMLIAEQKRTLKHVKEENHEQLEAVESKCSTQRAVNQRLEEHVMYLTNKLDESERCRIPPRSPDGSVHDASVSVSSAGSAAGRLLGLSPPLAESLRAADRLPLVSSSSAAETVEMRSLQLIAEQADLGTRQDSEATGLGAAAVGT